MYFSIFFHHRLRLLIMISHHYPPPSLDPRPPQTCTAGRHHCAATVASLLHPPRQHPHLTKNLQPPLRATNPVAPPCHYHWVIGLFNPSKNQAKKQTSVVSNLIRLVEKSCKLVLILHIVQHLCNTILNFPHHYMGHHHFPTHLFLEASHHPHIPLRNLLKQAERIWVGKSGAKFCLMG